MSVVDNVEDYFPGMGDFATVNAVDQEYVAQPNDLQILANLLHHEGCGQYFANKVFGGDLEMGSKASMATGYVCINRALLNYGGYIYDW